MRPDPPAPEHTALALTGERTLPGVAHENYWFQRHVVAYRLVAGRAAGRAVLDAGCGEGYGPALLAAAGARRVVAADLDTHVVEHIRRAYAPRHAAIEPVACELMALPLPDNTVDLTVSFQVIEHLYDIPGYLRSLHRVTRVGGHVVIATPNRLTFTPDSDGPVNPFHTREFSARELITELAAADLEVQQVVGVHHTLRLRAIEAAAGSSFGALVARPPGAWPPWLRATVAAVRPGWFRVSARDLDASLDLVARCVVR